MFTNLQRLFVKKIMPLAAITCLHNVLYAQRDTITLSLPAIEKRFIDSNLSLLAAHYNVDASKALIEQARLWNNPVLLTDQVIAAGGEFFPYHKNPDGTYSGQYYIQLQQLITTAGKRGKLIDLATTNKKITELELDDLLRNLRYQLHTDYFTLIQQTATNSLYQNENEQLSVLYKGMQAQYDAGNIALKDLLRVQALVIALQQDITENNKSIEVTETDLRILLRYTNNEYIRTDVNENNTTPFLSTGLENYIDSAKKNNPYFLLQQAQYLFQQQNLSYQKSLRVPDLTVGPEFDRNSQFAQNFFGLNISLPLPVFNRNQGNIKSAEFAIKQQQSLTDGAETTLLNNVTNAYNKLILTINQHNGIQNDFYNRYQSMFENMLKSYGQKQISLLELVDFLDAYKDTRLRFLQQQLNLELSKEELNYETGITLIN